MKVTNLVSRRAEKPEDLLAALAQISEKHFRELRAQDLGTEDGLEVSGGSDRNRSPQRDSKHGPARTSHVVFFIHTEVRANAMIKEKDICRPPQTLDLLPHATVESRFGCNREGAEWP